MERPRKSFNPQKIQRGRGGLRHTPSNHLYEVYSSGSRRLNHFSNMKLFILAVLAGGFMCLASLLSVLLTSDLNLLSAKYVLSGLGLSLGLLLILLTNSALFTEANIFTPGNFYRVSMARGCLRLFRFWLITWIGNVIGAFFFAYIIYLSQEYSDTFRQNLMSITTMKLGATGGYTYRTIGELILSGMLANWVVALASFFAIASRNLINQFIIVFLAFIFISASNFQYFPVNTGYFALNAFLVKGIKVSDAIFFNLIPVCLGNILGAALLVAGPFLYLSKKASSHSHHEQSGRS